MTERINGKIADVNLNIDYYGRLILDLVIEGKGWGVIVSSPSLVYYDNGKRKVKCNDEIVIKLYELLKFFKVDKIEQLKGKYITCIFKDRTFCKFLDIIDDDKQFEW